ncbi:MAG: putative sulfate exporter family transporter [Deltaproteobacteria bacterium]|nr:putative sulfate exporter family transporter [Deltaproteobacteria bacterium]
MEETKKGIGEDWLSLWTGLAIFVLGLGGLIGWEVLGWGIKTSVWVDLNKALSPISPAYKFSGLTSLFFTYLFLLGFMLIGARALGAKVGKFVVGFTLTFWISYACWLIGHYAHIAATPDVLQKYNITWSLQLTGEAGFIVALLAGLVVGNFFPKFSAFISESLRPELYIKTAIVILGAGLGAKAAESMGLASAVLFRGLCASVEVYLIDWAVVYLVARTVFKFNREWAVPLASGISICGVSAAIATGAAIRARPVVPIMVSSLVVIFAVVELILLPFLAQYFLWQEPMVAGDWMGLAVKTDGAAVASGAIVDSLVRAKALALQGIRYKEGWMIMSATTSKIFIDFFIGIWAFILAIIWCSKIECSGGRVKAAEIWERFPKFVLGYFLTFIIMLCISLSSPAALKVAKAATGQMDVFRVLFFVLTFFSIGAISNFRKLWEEGFGKLAAVYLLCLFGFIIWVGLLISWIFFHGIKPPLMTG